jgi:putrescine aminotransferase
MTFAKGVTSGYIPLGGVAVGDRVANVLIGEGGDFNHGFTYSGHPVSCAVAVENIRILQRERVVERVAEETAPYLKEKFSELADHPLVGMTETCGMVAGLILVKDKSTNALFAPENAVGMRCRGHCFNGGVVMRAVGHRMIIAPPLVITREEIDRMIKLIRAALDKTWLEVSQMGLVK